MQPEQDDSHHQYLIQKLRGKRVLAIDDNPSTREMIQESCAATKSMSVFAEQPNRRSIFYAKI